MTLRLITADEADRLASDLRDMDTLDHALALTRATQRHRQRKRIRRAEFRTGMALAAAALVGLLAGAFVTDAIATAARDAVDAENMGMGW